LKRDRKSLGFGNWVIGFLIEFTCVAFGHAVPPTEASPHATVADLPCYEFGVLNWVFGVLILVLVLFRNLATPSQSGICPHQSH